MNNPVKSAERALDILELLALRDDALTLTQIATGLELPKSSALMLLRTLGERGYLSREESGGYRLNPVFHESRTGWIGGTAALLAQAARPVMQELLEEMRETTVLGVLNAESDVRIVASLVSPQAVRYDLGDTTVLPSYCSALGQAILAYSPAAVVEAYLAKARMAALTANTLTSRRALRARLAQIRRQGVAIHIEERVPGASGAAAPIFAHGGRVVGALNISTVTFRFLQSRPRIVAALQASAARITALLGGAAAGPAQPSRRAGRSA